MNRQFVQGIVDSLTKSVGVDKERVSLAMGIGIAYSLGLPPGATENPLDWYTNNYQFTVQQFVSEFNERFLLDVSLVINGVKNIWLSRYNLEHTRSADQVSALIRGESPARKFVSTFELTDQDIDVIAQAAMLISDRIQSELKTRAVPTA